jgi:hypothetical protein
MRVGPRLRRWTKGTGVVVTLALAISWITSGWLCLSFWWDRGAGRVMMNGGGVVVAYDPSPPPIMRNGFFVDTYDYPSGKPRFQMWVWAPYVGTRACTGVHQLPQQRFLLLVPFWIPLVVVLVPTAILVWRDRSRIPAGHCGECGYNLTGNVSGRCPECGTAIECGTRNDER